MTKIGQRFLLLLAALLPAFAAAQDFPSRTVTIVIPGNPGGGMDFVGRAYANALGKRWKQPVNLDYKSGAAGQLASTAVANAPHDGHTILLQSDAILGYSLFIKGGFDALRELTPLGIMNSSPRVCFVGTQAPAKNWKDLVSYAKANPGALNIGNYTATITHLGLLRLFGLAGVTVTLVPYNDPTPLIRNTLGNEITGSCLSPLPLMENIKAGKLVPVAVAGTERLKALPEVPTFRELGLDFEWTSWNALFVGVRTSKDIVSRIQAGMAAVIREPELLERILKLGADPEFRPLAETVGTVERMAQELKATALAAGIRPE